MSLADEYRARVIVKNQDNYELLGVLDQIEKAVEKNKFNVTVKVSDTRFIAVLLEDKGFKSSYTVGGYGDYNELKIFW